MPASQRPRKKRRQRTIPKRISRVPALSLLVCVCVVLLGAAIAYLVGNNHVAYPISKEGSKAAILEQRCLQGITYGSKEHRQLERASNSLQAEIGNIVNKLVSGGFNVNLWEMNAYPSVVSDAVDKFERELIAIGCIE